MVHHSFLLLHAKALAFVSPEVALGSLSAHGQVPLVPKSLVALALLHPLDVVFFGEVQVCHEQVGVFSGLDVFAAVEHPFGCAVLDWVENDVVEFLCFALEQLSGFLGLVDTGHGQHHVAEHDVDAFDLAQSVEDVFLTIKVRVRDADDVLEFYHFVHVVFLSSPKR